jgi:secreted PhoX family phosphatase
MATMSRRSFVKRSSAVGGGLAGMGALQAFGAQVAAGQTPGASAGYGPLVAKPAQNDPSMVLRLPARFNFEVISRQGVPMDDGNPTPGIFDGTGSYEGRNRDETILIRNHENRRRLGEIPVVVPADKRYDADPTYDGGDTKLVVRRRRMGRNPDGTRRYTYEVRGDFAILGGTDTNCAGGVIGDSWYTCEEVVNRGATGLKHGYNYAIPAYANGPIKAVPLPSQGRFVHEAVAELDGILYETEDRGLQADALVGTIGAVFYRFVPDRRGGDDNGRRRGFAGGGRLQGLKLRDEPRANMDVGRVVGRAYPVEWVDVDQPDHEDDTDDRRDRVPSFTPTRIQAIDKGAAFFDRQEGIWTAGEGRGRGKVYFDCTTGGAQNLGQVWEYDPRRETITLIFESTSVAQLEGPDNVVLVPRTGDIFLQEDASGTQFIRGLTADGRIYDFAETVTNDTEFCGGCFDEVGFTLFVSQQGERCGNNPPGTFPSGPGALEGTPDARAVTYAIYGPFEDRAGRRRDD